MFFLFYLFDRTGIFLLTAAAAVFHEAGHILVLCIMNIEIESADLYLQGIKIKYKEARFLSYPKEIIIALAGPAVNLLIFILFSLAFKNIGLETFGYINLILAIFNLLPIEKLDGGRAVKALMLQNVEYVRANTVTAVISWITILISVIFGIYILVNTRYNFTLCCCACFCLIAMLGKDREIIQRI
jgi:stage IV sporulation protein FB